MKHFAARKYISVYERMGEIYQLSTLTKPGGFVMDFKYPHGEFADSFYGQVRPTTRPKLTYTVMRIRSRRVGQLELLPILRSVFEEVAQVH